MTATETIDNGSAKYLHEGTGVYGPHGRPIVIEPKGKKALRWPGAKHPVKSVTQKGIKPLDFLRLAMQQSRTEAQVRLLMKSLIKNQAALANTGGGDSPSNDADTRLAMGVSLPRPHACDGVADHLGFFDDANAQCMICAIPFPGESPYLKFNFGEYNACMESWCLAHGYEGWDRLKKECK